MTFRSDLQAHIQDAFGDGYTVYEVGQDLIKTPCIVINPSRSNYIVPVTMGVDAAVQIFISLWLVTNRSSVPDAVNHLERMRKTASEAVKSSIPRGRWTTFGNLGSTMICGVPISTGVMECVFVSDDNQEGVA